MAYCISDLGDAIEAYNHAVEAYEEGDISDDDVEDARTQIVRIAQSIYFNDGQFNETAYQMHKPDGALITVEGGRVFVQVNDANHPDEIENLHIPSPGPDPY